MNPLRWPWEPSAPVLPPELRIEIPESVQAFLDGAVQTAYTLGLIHGVIGGVLVLLALRYIFSK